MLKSLGEEFAPQREWLVNLPADCLEAHKNELHTVEVLFNAFGELIKNYFFQETAQIHYLLWEILTTVLLLTAHNGCRYCQEEADHLCICASNATIATTPRWRLPRGVSASCTATHTLTSNSLTSCCSPLSQGCQLFRTLYHETNFHVVKFGLETGGHLGGSTGSSTDVFSDGRDVFVFSSCFLLYFPATVKDR